MTDTIGIRGTHFVCPKTNRILQLRGISLSGSSKLPASLPSHSSDTEAFFDHANVSYIGRPFPLAEMDEHLSRIREWGFTIVRLVVPWEALEHAGWRQYDVEYIEYLAKIVAELPKYGLSCIIDAHQDVFSRLTGGSGAPGWVLDVLGLSVRNLHETHSAHLHPLALLATDPPPAVWPTGYQKLAAATCNTVFWAGDRFAWKRKAPDGSGRGLSTFLQEAMAEAFGQLADKLEGYEAVLGFEPMNEPHRGYLELHSMYTFDPKTDLQLGYHPNALESFALGDGYPQRVPYYVPSFPKPTRISKRVVVNSKRERAWQKGSPCIWREHGVWEWDEKAGKPVPLQQTYFSKDPRTGEAFDWYKDAWYPFLKTFRNRVGNGKEARKAWMTFAGGIPNEFTPEWPAESQPENFVSTPHWYDLHALFSKSFGNFTFNVQGLSRGMFPLKAIYLGQSSARDNYALQLSNIIKASNKQTGRPCLIGECGIPFDMNKFAASKTQDWRWQERQLDALCTGLERSLSSYILWNYNPENDDEHGDAWYGENFSLFSKSVKGPDGKMGAGRCVDAFQRPYAIATPGQPNRSYFDLHTLFYVYQFRNHPADDDAPEPTTRECEIYLPVRRYGPILAKDGAATVRVTDGTWRYDEEKQILYWTVTKLDPLAMHRLEIRVVDNALHRSRPGDIDLKESPLRWVLALLIVIAAMLFRLFKQKWDGGWEEAFFAHFDMINEM